MDKYRPVAEVNSQRKRKGCRTQEISRRILREIIHERLQPRVFLRFYIFMKTIEKVGPRHEDRLLCFRYSTFLRIFAYRIFSRFHESTKYSGNDETIVQIIPSDFILWPTIKQPLG